ncbi:hypothetical protein DPEC_G00243990 [Dallia pectoralis]|uniref:Uncharacterized protein n=1 Tax=Dallia pectoralis TaxID=75939 RepID=A0ACC2FVL4_DALPE|nr:hypothetical protein DPEC_G00243990 [Dallia pectoralis]
MIFAVNEVNRQRDLLPRLTLGYHIRDSCDQTWGSMRSSLVLVNGQPGGVSGSGGAASGPEWDCAAVHRAVSPVIIGDAASGVSMAVLRTLGSFHIPLVSYFASCSCLSDKKQFPTFMRTMPSDAFQIKAMAHLVRYFNWTWVGIIGVESDYARFAIQLFLQESIKYSVCAAYVNFYSVNLSQRSAMTLVDTIQRSSSRVILNFSGELELQSILRECQRRNFTGLQWIASEAWSTATSLWGEFGDLLTGTLGFAIRKADVIPGLKEYLKFGPSDFHESAFLSEFWEDTFNCRLNESMNTHLHSVSSNDKRKPCTGKEDLGNVYTTYGDVSQLRVSYNVYKAVYLIAHALQEMSNCMAGQGPFVNGTCGNPKNVNSWQLLHYMKQVKFSTLGEDVSFDDNSDPIASYDLMNWQRGHDGSVQLVKVGFYDDSMVDGRNLIINDSAIEWPVGKKAVQSICNERCHPGTRLLLRVDRVCQATAQDVCTFLGERDTDSFYQDGDVVIGGLFPLHQCSSSLPSFHWKPQQTHYEQFNARTLRWMRTMIFAVNEVNRQRDLLPRLKLGYHIRDCDQTWGSMRSSLVLVNGQPGGVSGSGGAASGPEWDCAAVHRAVSPVIIGDAASGVSMAVLRTLGSFHIPLVSYFASCSCLSDKKQFPTFMRTMPSDTFQIRAMVQLALYFNWTWVGVIGAESDYARFAIQLFLEESKKYSLCAAFVHFYPVNLSQHSLMKLVDNIQRSASRVILNFSGEVELRSILRECQRRNFTGLQWIASEAWSTATSLWGEFGDLLTGTLGFAIRKADVIPGLKEYLQFGPSDCRESAFLAEFWEDTFNCRLNESLNTHLHSVSSNDKRKPCTGKEDLGNVYTTYGDVSQLRVSYNVYKAVYLIAHALQEMSNCMAGQGPFVNGTCGNPKHIKSWQLLHYMKQVKFSTLGEEVSFDHNGDPTASYDLMNWQRGQDGSMQLVKVGFYDASILDGRNLFMNESVIQWHVGMQAVQSICSERCHPGTRMASRKGEPVCCFDCIPCAEGERSASRVILNFSGEVELRSILRECQRRNFTGLQWIASEAWSTATSLWGEFGDLLTGTLGFAIRKADVIPGLKEYLKFGPSDCRESAFLAEFWEDTFNCRLNESLNTHLHSVSSNDKRKPCTGKEDLGNVYTTYGDVSQLRVSYNVYKAVYLIAHALQEMSNCKAGQGPFVNGTCGNPKNVKSWQLLHYMKQVKFSTLGEEVSFDHNGDPIASYDLMNWQRGQDGSMQLVKVGFYDASILDGRNLFMNESVIQWHVGMQIL